MKKSILAIITIILGIYILSCLPKAKFTMESMSPKLNSTNVPLNVVLKAVFLSEGNIKKDSLSLNKFSLEKVKKQTEKKDQTSNSSNTKTQTTTTDQSKSPEQTAVETEKTNGILIIESKSVISDDNYGVKTKIQTTVYFVPSPKDENATTTLDPDSKYIFKIETLEDENKNTFSPYTLTFTTTGSGFEFSTNPKIDVLTPSNYSNLYKYPIAKDQGFVFESDGPLNPLHLKNNCKLTSIYSKNPDFALEGKKDEKTKSTSKNPTLKENSEGNYLKTLDFEKKILNRRINLLEKDIDQLRSTMIKGDTKAQQEISDKEKERDEKKSQLAEIEEDEKIALELTSETQEETPNDEAKINTEAENTNDNSSETTSLDYIKKDAEDVGFSMYFLEDFNSQKDNEFIEANFNKFMISTKFSSYYLYRLAIQLNKEEAPIQTFELIRIDESLKPDTDQFTAGLTKINFQETKPQAQ